MKTFELRKKNDQDLQKMLLELRDKVRETRFKIASKEIKNHQLLHGLRKDIARILTIVKQRTNAK